MIVAALPIPNNLNAEDLLVYLEQIIDGLLSQGVKVRSYSADGTEVERSLQRLMMTKGTMKVLHCIKNPRNGCADFNITVATFKGHPIVMQQDPPHSLK